MTARPHDALFKETFSDVANARGELTSVLPADVSALVDWDTLRLEPGSFVDQALRETMTDLLFSVRIGGREARLYLLFEHQSRPDSFMPLRALAYLVRVWEAWLREHEDARRLPPVIPVVLAQVDGGWTAPTELHAIVDYADEAERAALAPWVPSCRLLLDDLALLSHEDLDARAMPDRAKLTLAALRDVRGASDVLAVVRSWARWIRAVSETSEGRAALGKLLRYTLPAGHRAKAREIVAEVREIDARAGETAMTIAEDLIQEGRVEGRLQGRAEMLLKLLRLRFGAVPESATERIARADADTLDRWAERVLTAASVEDVLAG